LPPDDPVTVTPPTCVNCGRPWIDAASRWRSYLDDEGEQRLYCPECSSREFGDDDA
jgi:DNA-directed RNA polymerase subunit RPC12/RpoP